MTRQFPEINSRIRVRGSFGHELPREVTVISCGMEFAGIEAQPVVDYREDDGTERWAYLWQVEGDDGNR